MPVLARVIESFGISTIVVTMMPNYAERCGVPRAAGVAYPFGHPFGRPGDVPMQLAVIRDALRLLAAATHPNTVTHLPYQWPEPQEIAYKAWQPREMSPVVRFMRERTLAARAERERATPEPGTPP